MKLKNAVDGKSYEVDIEVLEDDERTSPPGYLPPLMAVPSTLNGITASRQFPIFRRTKCG